MANIATRSTGGGSRRLLAWLTKEGAGEDGEVVQEMTAVLQCVLVRGDAHGVLEFKSVLYCLVLEYYDVR